MHILTALLALLPLLIGLSCANDGASLSGDADRTDFSEADGGADGDGDVGAYVLKGTSNEGGNAITVFMTLVAYNPAPLIQWTTLTLGIRDGFLPDHPACMADAGERLVSQSGDLSLSLLSVESPRLKLVMPAGRSFCSLDFLLPPNPVPLYMDGVDSKDRHISVALDFSGRLRLIPELGTFLFQAGRTANWLLALDIGALLPEDVLDSLEPDDKDVLRVDAAHNPHVFDDFTRRTARSFVIYEDSDGNGRLDPGEAVPEAVIARGTVLDEPEPETEGDGDLDGDLDGEADADGDEEADPDADEDPDVEAPPDRDRDGRPDAEDNCPDHPNPLQENNDADGFGDACDNCPYADNPLQEDDDDDRLGNACDPTPDRGDFCQMIPCAENMNLCFAFGLSCTEIDANPFFDRACSKPCQSDAQCPAPWACIDDFCRCRQSETYLDCPLLECTLPGDCSEGANACVLPLGYCTTACGGDEQCKQQYGVNWSCKNYVMAGDVCQCDPSSPTP